MEKEPLKFSNSMISDYITCPRKYYYTWELLIEPRAKNPHLWFGGLIHECLEIYYNPGGTKEKAIEHLLSAYHELDDDESPWTKAKNSATGLMALEEFFSNSAYYNFGEVIAVEKPIHSAPVTIAGEPVSLSGKPDLVVRVSPTKIMVVDYKTPGRIDADLSNKWKQNRGLIGYSYLARNEYPGMEIESLVSVFHMITVPRIIRFPYAFSPTHENECVQASYYYASQIIFSRHTGLWFKSGHPCQIFSGCPYQCLCDQILPDERLDKLIIPATFKKREECLYTINGET